ncbi:MAG TPA: cyanophycin synthetase, partial [Polyangiaceae bacterium]|nr:cyanophycin synthetase [Polyangiaceae bacterium]
DLRSVIDAVARGVGATTSTVDHVPAPARVGLDGDHQKDNARVAAVLGARIGASPAAIAEGIAGARWPGRLERIGPFLLDAAHNPDGAEALARHVRALGLPPGEVGLIFGALADKDWRRMLDALTPLASERCYVLAGAGARAAVDPALMAGSYGGITAAGASEACSLFERRMRQAGQAGQGAAPSLVVVAGSMLVVGEARARLLSLPRDPPVAL